MRLMHHQPNLMDGQDF